MFSDVSARRCQSPTAAPQDEIEPVQCSTQSRQAHILQEPMRTRMPRGCDLCRRDFIEVAVTMCVSACLLCTGLFWVCAIREVNLCRRMVQPCHASDDGVRVIGIDANMSLFNMIPEMKKREVGVHCVCGCLEKHDNPMLVL